VAILTNFLIGEESDFHNFNKNCYMSFSYKSFYDIFYIYFLKIERDEYI